MFTPGETAIHSFIIPFKKKEIDKIIVSYKQQDDIILEVPIASNYIRDAYDGSEYLYTVFDIVFTEEQSLLFREYECICGDNGYEAQINVLLNSGARFTSTVMPRRNGTQLYREVMGNG